MLFGADDFGDREVLQPRAGIFDAFDFKSDRRQFVSNSLSVGIRFKRCFEPRERELHRLSPPSRVGRSSAAKPKWRNQRMSLSKNGRRSGAPYFSIAMRSRPKPK